MAKTSLRRSPRLFPRPTAPRSRSERFFRQSRLEALEPRWVLSAPTLAAIADVTVVAGAPLHVALDGFDLDGDTLSYSVSATNSSLTATVHEGNRSLRIVVPGYGDMVFELFEDLAPETTARIIELAESGFYDDLIFHRIAEYTDGTPFVIQGGDPDGTGTGGSGVDFDDEFSSLAASHQRGRVVDGQEQRRHERLAVLHHRHRHAPSRLQPLGFRLPGRGRRGSPGDPERPDRRGFQAAGRRRDAVGRRLLRRGKRRR